MKNKITNHLWKIVTVALLTVMLVIGVSYVTDVNGADAYAADATTTDVTPEDVDYKLIKYSSITRTKDTETGLYINDIPQYSDSNGGAWLFAGWYTDETLTEHVTRNETEAENVIAKFVSADILSVKCQLSEGTDATTSQDTVLRCVSSVDSLKYNKIGFDIVERKADGTLDYANAPKKEDNRVGTRINAKDAKDAYTYSPKVIDTESEYFFSTTITVDQKDFGTKYLIKPYWITKDGTKVYGVSRYVTVNEGIEKNIIHATIKMVEPTDATEYTTDVTGATVTYIDHDGTYAHFTISVSDRTALNSVTKFVISDENGAVGTYYYRNLLTSYNGSNADESWYEAYKDGEGNLTEDEFVIASSADFYGMYDAVMDSKDSTNEITFSGYTIYLVSDITANSVTVTDNTDGTKNYTWGTQHTWTPVGTANFEFAGVFDGQGHTIKGLYVTGSQYLGLFAVTNNNSCVQKINLKDSYLFDDGTETSVLIGSVAGRGMGTFEDIYSDATIVCSKSYAGGLVGQTAGEVTYTNCHFAGNLTMGSDGQYGGGIVGYTKSATKEVKITGCVFSGTIISETLSTSTKKPGIGGICGYQYDVAVVTVDKCVSSGDLNTNFATSSAGYVGSVFGMKRGKAAVTISISNTYVTDSGLRQVGNNADVTGATAYSDDVDLRWYDVSPTGSIISDADDLYGFYLLSLVKGNMAGKILRLGDNIKLNGDMTVQDMKNGLDTTDNTEDDPNMWTPIPEFAGIFDGQGYSINGLCVEATSNYAGMFAKVTGATIKNLCVEDSTFNSSKNFIACIAGDGYGTFEKIQIASNVEISSDTSGVAGIIGRVSSGESSFTQCWNAGSITATNKYAGGLIGRANEKVTIVNCLNTGTITANESDAGGLIGWHYASEESRIKNCVNAGTIVAGNTSKGALVGNLNSSGTVALTYSYNTYTDVTEAAGAGSDYLKYENATEENSEPDYINVSVLTPSNFEHLDDTIWTLIEGQTPSLTCFVTE